MKRKEWKCLNRVFPFSINPHQNRWFAHLCQMLLFKLIRINKFNDGFNLISKLTFSRAVNVAVILGSYLFSRLTHKAWHKGYPISISIEPTTSCNLRCPECPSGLRSFTRPAGMLEPANFRKVINEVQSFLLYLQFYFQGEPYLNSDFLEMVAYASSKNIYTATSTNGHYLTMDNAEKTVRSGLDRLIISIDGTTQETYEAYRVGGRLSKVLEGTKNIIFWKKKLNSRTPHVVFQFLVVKPNQHQIGDVKVLASQLGVDEVVLKTAQIYDYENGSPLMPDIDRFSRYKKNKEGYFTIKNKLFNNCWKMWHSCVITWDGKVVPCCFDKDASQVMGRTGEALLKSIWKGKNYGIFRKTIMRSRSEVEICRNCTEGTKVFERLGI
jgi:radical SAM protein with 4Fe4S-binding SPASM domain